MQSNDLHHPMNTYFCHTHNQKYNTLILPIVEWFFVSILAMTILQTSSSYISFLYSCYVWVYPFKYDFSRHKKTTLPTTTMIETKTKKNTKINCILWWSHKPRHHLDVYLMLSKCMLWTSDWRQNNDVCQLI